GEFVLEHVQLAALADEERIVGMVPGMLGDQAGEWLHPFRVVILPDDVPEGVELVGHAGIGLDAEVEDVKVVEETITDAPLIVERAVLEKVGKEFGGLGRLAAQDLQACFIGVELRIVAALGTMGVEELLEEIGLLVAQDHAGEGAEVLGLFAGVL